MNNSKLDSLDQVSLYIYEDWNRQLMWASFNVDNINLNSL
jgi:hypothetical protein